VAYFSADETGESNGPAYTDSWHSERYWSRIRHAASPREVAEILSGLGIHYIITPDSRPVNSPPVEGFLRLWLTPVRKVGSLGLFRMPEVAPPDPSPFAPGRRYDDLEERVRFSGSWLHDVQFPETSGQSITYSETPGNAFRIAFTGSAITYVFTRAANRGIAEVWIDGRRQSRINQYSPRTLWQSSERFGGLSPGDQTLEVRVSGEKDPLSAGVFVDLDAFEVEP
jgi:hypothetical protein